MTPKQFWTQLALKVAGFLIIAALLLVFLSIISTSQVCETVQVTEFRSMTQCSLRP